MDLPTFRYHPDPIASGSIVPSDDPCPCCNRVRGYGYDGPIYCEPDVDNLCPWCIADGSAHRKWDASFMDSEALAEEIPKAAADEITLRTPGYSSWQSGGWPACCGDATAFIIPAGIDDLRRRDYQIEGLLMGHIVHEMGISGCAATRLLQSLDKDHGPTAYLFQCLHCRAWRFHIDSL